MSALFRFVVSVWLIAAVCSARRLLGSLSESQKKDFDYFLLVRQWPGSFCNEHSCPLLPDRGDFHFTIHGLWPNFKDGSWPQFCNSHYKFNEDELNGLLDEMRDEWPSFFDSDESFWDHEWSKHGTCSLDILPTERNFFSTVLKLHRRFDLAAALSKADILPSRSTTYRSKDLIGAVYDMYGVRPLIHCNGRELSEVWICFDKDLKPFSCDTAYERNSCTEVAIPPLKHETSEAIDVAVARDGVAEVA